jgi:hypothetical protein
VGGSSIVAAIIFIAQDGIEDAHIGGRIGAGRRWWRRHIGRNLRAVVRCAGR